MFGVIIVIAVIGLIVAAANQQHKRIASSWGEVAGRLGIQMESGSWFSNPKLTGTLNGIPLYVDSYSRRSNNSPRTAAPTRRATRAIRPQASSASRTTSLS